MTRRLTKQCRAPRQKDAYPCKNPTSEPGTTCHKHHGLPRIPEGERGPRYLDGYHDHLIFRLKSRIRVHPAPGHWASVLHVEARERYACIDNLLDERLTANWIQDFEDQASQVLGPAAMKRTTSAQACRRCDRLAFAAQYALDTGELPDLPCVSLLLAGMGLPCLGVEDALVGALGAGSGMTVSPIAAGRVLQLIGVQACQRRNRSVQDCFCARAVVRDEGEGQLMKLLRYGTGDWEQLGELSLTA